MSLRFDDPSTDGMRADDDLLAAINAVIKPASSPDQVAKSAWGEMWRQPLRASREVPAVPVESDLPWQRPLRATRDR